jgi:hypothetical protein
MSDLDSFPIPSTPLRGSFYLDSVDSLRGRNITGTTSGVTAILSGYNTAGDGAGGPPRVFSSGQPAGTYVDDGGSVLVPTGGNGSQAWLLPPEGGMQNILWWGADPTGASDSTTAIQNCVNYVQKQGGGIVFTPAGTFKISQAILAVSKITAGITFKGVSRYASTWKQTTAGDDGLVVGQAGQDYCSSCVIEDMGFSGGRYCLHPIDPLVCVFQRLFMTLGTQGMFVEGQCEETSMRDLQIVACSSSAWSCGNANGADFPEMQKCTLSRILIDSCGNGSSPAMVVAAGMLGSQQTCRDNEISGLVFTNCNCTQLYLSYVTNTTIRHMEAEAITLTTNTYEVVSLNNCTKLTFDQCQLPGVNDAVSSSFRYCFYAPTGNLQITMRDVITGTGGAASIYDIFFGSNVTGSLYDCSCTSNLTYSLTTQSVVQILNLQNSAGVVIIGAQFVGGVSIPSGNYLSYGTATGLFFVNDNGIQLGGATGGNLGAGTLNVKTGIYLNNTAYTNP